MKAVRIYIGLISKKGKYIELRAPECERAWGLVVGVHGGTLSAGFDPVSHTP
jgi:hypothetical protein